jgi:hypothetical protein
MKLNDESEDLCDSIYLNNPKTDGNSGKQHFRNAGVNLQVQMKFKGLLQPNHRASQYYAAIDCVNKDGDECTPEEAYAKPPDVTKCAKNAKTGEKELTKECLELQYKNVPPLELEITVAPQTGWATKGIKIFYPTSPMLEVAVVNSIDTVRESNTSTDEVKDVEDRYMRGIIFTTAASGSFTVFDEIALATRVASLLIFLQIAGVITALIAFNCLAESRIYKFGSKSPMNIDREYAKFAATATQSMTVFKQLVSSDSKYGHLTEADLFKHLSQGPIQVRTNPSSSPCLP